VPRRTYVFTAKELSYRATLPMTKAMRSFLEELSTRTKDQGGHYFDRSQILRSLIRTLLKLEGQVDWSQIRDEDELVRRLIRAFSKK